MNCQALRPRNSDLIAVLAVALTAKERYSVSASGAQGATVDGPSSPKGPCRTNSPRSVRHNHTVKKY